MHTSHIRSIAQALLAISFLAAVPGVAAEEGRRIALVIGNDAYAAGPLQNAVNDARAMQKALAAAGFRVILSENANKVALEQSAAEFLQAIGPGDTALFFFAGHAVQIENENLLLPVDFAPGRTVIEAKFRSFSLSMIFDYLKRARARTTIVIIDACRSNPAAGAHSLQSGLAIPLNAGKETYIAFSTSPNHVAGDNPDGKNSWFTESLAQEIAKPGLTIDDVLTRVRMKVESATGGAQTPWSQTSLTSRFYFNVPKDAEDSSDASVLTQWLSDAVKHERQGNWPEAIELANRIVKLKRAGPEEQTAIARLPYWIARSEAAAKFQAGDFPQALAEYEKASKLESFDVDAAFEAAACALLIEDLPRAVRSLESVRALGSSVAVARADAMLKQIGAVDPTALAATQRGLPPPPAIQSLFPAHRFGVPDFQAGPRFGRRASPVDFAAAAKQIAAAAELAAALRPTPVEPTAAQPTQDAPLSPDAIHVDIKSAASAGRDLVVEGYGELALVSESGEAGVLLDGKQVARKLPYTVRLAPGNYDVRVQSTGQTIAERQVQIRSGQKVELVVKKE